jgi:uncharacterized membrane protein YidH (DUF202 family)
MSEHSSAPQSATDVATLRPARFAPAPVPAIPRPDTSDADTASIEYSHYRTGLSRHRTELSEHRTDLSEFRTDLSQHRTELSEHRTDLSQHRTDLSTNRTELSMRRTGMSFQRTRLSADRTLMSVIRTSLSMIGFGFTIYQAFEKLRDAGVIKYTGAPRNFGLALIVLGMLVLIGGILRDIRFERELRQTRAMMSGSGLVHGESRFPISITLIVAIALFALGALAVIGIAFNVSFLG